MSNSFKCRAILLSNTCDLPAKAIVLNMVNHNGFYSCPRCIQPGKTTKTKRGHVHTFPYISTSPTGPLRTAQMVKEDAKLALQKHTTVNGIRGPGSCLMTFPNYDIVRGTAIDYMHCVLLNVVRQLTRLWFDSTHSTELWSCSRSVSLVDSRLENIQPPSLISRVTHAISKRKFWKASEYRAWLFFYSLPVMYMILPDVYYQHYVLLCEAIYILNTKSVQPSDIEKSRKLLQHFYFMFPTLYSERYLGCNIHQLLHLPDTVRELGPLFTTSCFDHEDTNGKLAKMVHSHACVGSQILSSFSSLQRLWDLSNQYVDPGSPNFERISVLIDSKTITLPKSCTPIDKECSAIGACTEERPVSELLQCLPSVPDVITKFGRLLLRKEVYHSLLYERPTRHNDNAIMYEDSQECGLKFGLVSFFCMFKSESNRVQVYAIVEELIPNTSVKIAKDTITNASASHITPCYPPTASRKAVVPVKSIVEKVVYMHFADVTDCTFVAVFPNTIEGD